MVRFHVTALASVIAVAGCGSDSDSINDDIRDEAAAQGMVGSPQLDQPDWSDEQLQILDKRVELGKALFHDKALSGVQQTSCATCHHPEFHGADGASVARGVFCTKDGSDIACETAPADGADGNVVGPERTSPLNERNSPSVVNSALFPKQMLDGRFHYVDDSSLDVNDLDTSMGFEVQDPEAVLFARSMLGAQAFKPVPSPIEMAGDFEFEGGPLPDPEVFNPAVRDGIVARLNSMAAYRTLFEEAYPAGADLYPNDIVIGPGDDISYEAIADAMATWEEQDLVMTQSPWDAFLAGDDDAISDSAKSGALIFLTRGQCSGCHSGDLFSDFENYNLGVPQVGPGFGDSDDTDPAYGDFTSWDFGFEATTSERADRFKFRTPPLRGVALTSPYMHNGAYASLEDAIRHHVDPSASYEAYDDSQLDPEIQSFELKPLGPVFDAQNPVAVGPGTEFETELSEQDIADLVEFLKALTDPRMREMSTLAPATVPSGLPVDVAGAREFPLYE